MHYNICSIRRSRLPNFIAFISYVFVTSFTPGPNNIMAMTNASHHGFRKSIPFNLGVGVGFFTILILSNLFSVTLYRYLPTVKPVVTWIGFAYILWLAYKTYKSTPIETDDETTPASGFTSGVLLQFVNPKAILYSITTVSTFIVPFYDSPVVLVLFSLFLAGVSFLSTGSWALFGSLFQRFMKKHYKVFNTVMALLLVYCAVSLFT